MASGNGVNLVRNTRLKPKPKNKCGSYSPAVIKANKFIEALL